MQYMKGEKRNGKQNHGKHIENIHEAPRNQAAVRPQILGAMLNEKRKIEVTEYYEICKAMGANPDAIAAEAGIWEQDKAAQLV